MRCSLKDTEIFVHILIQFKYSSNITMSTTIIWCRPKSDNSIIEHPHIAFHDQLGKYSQCYLHGWMQQTHFHQIKTLCLEGSDPTHPLHLLGQITTDHIWFHREALPASVNCSNLVRIGCLGRVRQEFKQHGPYAKDSRHISTEHLLMQPQEQKIYTLRISLEYG